MKSHTIFDNYVVAYVVASVDILGAKELITTGKGFEIIRKEYQRTIDYFKRKNSDKNYDIGARIFSDNILFYLKVPPFNIPSKHLEYRSLYIMTLSQEIKNFQNRLLIQNILVRGGITYGEFYKDEKMVWGKSLVRAYELESKIAIYPRIILDPQIELDKKIFNTDGETENEAILKDVDGLEFLNFISPLVKTKTNFEPIYHNIEKEIQKNKSKDNIVQKYKWLKTKLDQNIENQKETNNG